MRNVFIFLSLWAGTLSFVWADAYVSESFEYPAGQALGKCFGGEGFRGGSWRDTTGTRGKAAIVAPGIAFGGLRGKGGALALTFERNEGAQTLDVSRSVMQVEDVSKPVWIALLMEFPEGTAASVLADIKAFFCIVGTDKQYKYRLGIGDKKAHIRHGGDIKNEGYSRAFTVRAGQPYLLVAYFPGQTNGNASAQNCQLWVLEKSIGPRPTAQGESALRALLDKQAVATASAPMTAASLRAGDAMQVGVWGRKQAVADLKIDEIRFGSALTDVLPLAR